MGAFLASISVLSWVLIVVGILLAWKLFGSKTLGYAVLLIFIIAYFLFDDIRKRWRKWRLSRDSVNRWDGM